MILNKECCEILSEDTSLMEIFLFPNRHVVTFNHLGMQIPELQGFFSKELMIKMKPYINSKTKFTGFKNENNYL